MNNLNTHSECPICCKSFPADTIEIHVNRCIFLNTTEANTDSSVKEQKRSFSVFQSSSSPTSVKKPKLDVKKKTAPASGKQSAAMQKISTLEINDDDFDDKDVSVVNPFSSLRNLIDFVRNNIRDHRTLQIVNKQCH